MISEVCDPKSGSSWWRAVEWKKRSQASPTNNAREERTQHYGGNRDTCNNTLFSLRLFRIPLTHFTLGLDGLFIGNPILLSALLHACLRGQGLHQGRLAGREPLLQEIMNPWKVAFKSIHFSRGSFPLLLLHLFSRSRNRGWNGK